MGRRRRYLHPDYRMTRAAWLIAVIFAAEVAFALWVFGVIRPL